MEQTDIEEAIQIIRLFFPAVQGVYVFGSEVSGDVHAESDLDLAILMEKTLEPEKLWDIAQEIAIHIGRDVDLLDLRAASTVMRMQVVGKGTKIACFDEPACEIFEDFVFSDYARLNEERAEILKDIGRQGVIYG